MPKSVEELDPKQFIIVKGAREHNLKNLDLAIRRNSLTVITGLSGSGKSSLAFDTIYAEGQRRYVESLSAYARQFLGKIEKPNVDYIKGISPAIAIEQKVNTTNPRSTVGTSTEIYDYLKLLYARLGKTISPISGKEVKRHTVEDVVNEIMAYKPETKLFIVAPVKAAAQKDIQAQLKTILQQGFSRVLHEEKVIRLDDAIGQKLKWGKFVDILVDRIIVREDDPDLPSRVADSVQTAFYEGDGSCMIIAEDQSFKHTFSNKFELDGMAFEPPSVHLFSFNNPVGACKTCEGYGSVIGIDDNLVIPNPALSVYEDAVVCWKGDKMKKWKNDLIYNADQFDFPVHKPISELSKEQYDLLWNGNSHFRGIHRFFKMVQEKSYKIQYRVLLSRYRGKTLCHECGGTRLRKDANYVKFHDKSIRELIEMPCSDLLSFFSTTQFNEFDEKVGHRLLKEITNRLQYLNDVGLGYLTLNRLSNSLSGGESQRINLATSLGSSLVGSLYILDEPSIGLHPRDTRRLIDVIVKLKKLGNTVIIVEHDEDIMQSSDDLIDLGPEAGTLGGKLVFQGNPAEVFTADSLTAGYLSGQLEIKPPDQRRKWKDYIEVQNLYRHNLKGISVKFPLRTLTCVTGVSGSGKSTLVSQSLYPLLKKWLQLSEQENPSITGLSGSLKSIQDVQFIDQNPIGRSSRSNPVTYIKAFDDIRQLYANQKLAKMNGLKSGSFSFNVDGGRCDVCKGEGEIKVEMQFMADIRLVCDECKGQRFKENILEIKFKDLNIAQLLDLTIDQAIDFFHQHAEESTWAKKIAEKLLPLQEVGLGYVHLGQSSSTLSGGEAQRVKLASFLGKTTFDHTVFIFDEPTTGLHFHDIKKLLAAFNALIKKGHSLIVIEHNQDVIKCADWVIDIGPEGGEKGGNIVFEGTPDELVKESKSHTGKYLLSKLN